MKTNLLKTFFFVVSIFLIGYFSFLLGYVNSPDTKVVTKVVHTVPKFKVGGKVIYNNWDASIVGIYPNDETYVIKYCGHIGWANAWGCERTRVSKDEVGIR